MREFAGEPLEQILARGGPLPLASVPDVIDRVGTALAAAHAAGSVPADLKAAMAAAQGASVPDAVDPLDASAAQLWLAALAYNLLAGHPVPPLDAAQSVPKPIRAYRPEVPAETEAVVFRALNGDRQQRYGSLAEFASALRRSGAARLEQDEEERTTVSAVPSGIAAQLRRGHVELPSDERTIVSPSVSPSAVNDELTVVSPSGRQELPPGLGLSQHRGVPLATSSGTMFTPTQQMPRVRDRPKTLPPWVWPAVGVAALAIAVVTWRAIAGGAPPAPPPAPPPVPAVRASAPAPSAPVHPAAAVAPPAPPAVPPLPPPAPGPSPPVLEPPGPLPAAAEAPASASRGRPTHNHVRGRTAAAPEAAPTPAADGARSCRLSVASYPWAELWVDGADTGLQTPVVGFTISCGR
ncbi:MAG TPA: hypothetical protein VN962_10215, partial [Polyangia bacterium]|nr:hypothetical protein [Polyangia bacterium]